MSGRVAKNLRRMPDKQRKASVVGLLRRLHQVLEVWSMEHAG